MSSPEEVEEFEITDEDVYGALGHRRGRRQTKNQATYGMWADDDSDDERAGFGGKKKAGFTAPIGFVSGGIKQGDKTYKPGEEGDDIGADEDANDVAFKMSDIARLSMKPKSSKEGGSYRPGAIPHGKSQDFAGWEKHTKGVGMKLMQKMGFEVGKGLGKNKQGITTPVEAVKRKGKTTGIAFHGSERSERSLIDFPVQDQEEEETKQFKEQLSQWRKEPENKKKKVKYVYKTAQEAIDSNSGSSKKKPTKGHMSNVKVIDMTGKEKKVTTGYHSISARHDRPDDEADLVSDQPERTAFSMPELTHNLNLLVDMAEEDIVQNDRKLRHEKDLVVNMEYERERLDSVLEQEQKQLDRLAKILDIIATCNERTNPGCSNPVTLDECLAIFKVLQNEFYIEYKMYDLESLAIALVFPLMREHFKDWDPLSTPGFGYDVVKEWRQIIGDTSQPYVKEQHNMDVFEKLIWDVWLPHVRKAVLKWSVRECDPMISLLETWTPVLSPWISEVILERLVLPRLLSEADGWNPTQDTVPIHAWVHPWLPLMAEKLEPLYAPIRYKLGNALSNWHPSDSSAKVILKPWVGVWREGHTEVFLRKHILPKLTLCLEEFPINPHQQALEPLNWVFSWTEMISLRHMVPLFEKAFLPRWLQVLCTWLGNMPNYEEVTRWYLGWKLTVPNGALPPLNWVFSWTEMISLRHMVPLFEKAFLPRWLQVLCTWLGNMPNYEEVTRWYLGWKAVFPEQYLSHPSIKEKFTLALDMMNRAVSGHFQPGVKENMAYFTLTERRTIGEANSSRSNSPASGAPSEPPSVRSTTAAYPGSFRDLVERKAQENNLLFVPIPGKTHEAKPVYRCGATSMYIDRNVIFMVDKNHAMNIAQENNLLFVPIPGKTHEAKQVYRCGAISMYFDRNVIFMLDKNNLFIPVSLQNLMDAAAKAT